MKHRFLLLEISLYLPYAHSLKDKRQVKRSLVDSLRKLNLSVSETEDQDLHQKLSLSMAYVALDEGAAKKMIQTIEEHLYKKLPAETTLLTFEEEIL